MLKSELSLCVVLLSTVGILPCQCQWGNSGQQGNPEGGENKDGNKTGKVPMGSDAPTQPLPYALSSTYLTYLARTEQEMYKDIKNYVVSLKDRLQLAEAYLKDYEDSSIKGSEHLPADADAWVKATQVASNPLMSYRMVRRFSHEFDAFGAHVNQYLEGKLVDRVNKLGGKYGFPGDKDHTDALDAILRLHYVYDLNTEDLVRGKVKDVETHVGLTASQCYKIAEYAARNEYYTLALQWLRTTEAKMKEDNDTSVSSFSLANTYKRLIEKHDRDFEKNKYNGHLYMFTDRIAFDTNVPSLKQVNMEKYIGDRSDGGESGHYNFLALCNGEDYMSAKEKSKLYCWYERKNNPYFILFPLKMELLNKEPYLVQIYDIVNDAWIRDMRRAAMPTLQRAPPPNSPGATPRTAIYAWLEDEHIPETPIGRRIELLFNLKVRGMNASEALQIASYAFGAHVSTHYDSLGTRNTDDPIIKWKGDRVSTFLVYLNDVHKGGLTAFPLLGTHVKPIKGSAVYWHTSLRNGEIDLRMLHGACPIILGHKWIATKWTHANENFLKRPCALDPNI